MPVNNYPHSPQYFPALEGGLLTRSKLINAVEFSQRNIAFRGMLVSIPDRWSVVAQYTDFEITAIWHIRKKNNFPEN